MGRTYWNDMTVISKPVKGGRITFQDRIAHDNIGNVKVTPDTFARFGYNRINDLDSETEYGISYRAKQNILNGYRKASDKTAFIKSLSDNEKTILEMVIEDARLNDTNEYPMSTYEFASPVLNHFGMENGDWIAHTSAPMNVRTFDEEAEAMIARKKQTV